MQENLANKKRKTLFSLQRVFICLCMSAALLSTILIRKEYYFRKKTSTDYNIFFSSFLQCSRVRPSQMRTPLHNAEQIFCRRSNQLSSYSHFLASTSFLIGNKQKGVLYNNVAYNNASLLFTVPHIAALCNRIIAAQTQENYSEALQITKQLLQQLSTEKNTYPHLHFCSLLRAVYLSHKVGLDTRAFKTEIKNHPLYASYSHFLDKKCWKLANYIESF